MKRRFLYLLLFGLPALLASFIAAMLLFGAAAGLLWLFVLGDNPWPGWAEQLLGAAFVIAFAGSWLAFMSLAYARGKRQEASERLARSHVLAAAGASLLLLALIAAQQWSVGNLGGRSASLSCADYCRKSGYAGSGTPPRDAGAATCSCFDAQGRVAETVPLRRGRVAR